MEQKNCASSTNYATNIDNGKQIFNILYKLYHEQIDPLIDKYEKALQNDIKAIGRIKLESLNAALSINNSDVDKVPFAAHLRVIINEYREEHEYLEPSLAIYDIREAFEKSGEKILKQVFENEEYRLNTFDLQQRLSKFEYQYIKSIYDEQYIGQDSFEKFFADNCWEDFEDINEHLYIHYMDKSFWDVFASVDNRFGDMDSTSVRNGEQIIEEAKKEISWRKEYLKNPQKNSLISDLSDICEKTILDLISIIPQVLQLDYNLNSSGEAIDEINIEIEDNNTLKNNKNVDDDNELQELYPAQKLIDYSKAGAYKSNGCEKSFELLCICLNTGETIDSMLKHLNDLSKNHDECATQIVNKCLLDKVMTSTSANYFNFEADEKPLFYKDSAIMFYGKNGILITNKSIYRIRKNGIKKISFSSLDSIHLDNLAFCNENSCLWYLNNDNEFELDTIGIDAEQAGLIMALILLFFREINPNKKIKFYNYI